METGVKKEFENESEVTQGKREELIQVGLEMMIQSNSTNFSVKDVAEKAGVAVGLFYYYFASKEEFIYEAIASYMMTFAKRSQAFLEDGNLTARQKIHLIFSSLTEHLQDASQTMLQSLRSGNVRLILPFKIAEGLRPLVVEFIQTGIQKNEIKPHPRFTAVHLADFILYGITGILINTEVKDLNLGDALEQYAFELLDIGD